MVELLPAERDIRILQRRSTLSERTLQAHDAAIVVCEREGAEKLIAGLPYASTWQRLYRDARTASAFVAADGDRSIFPLGSRSCWNISGKIDLSPPDL